MLLAENPYALSAWGVTPLALGLTVIILLLTVGRIPLSYNVNNIVARWWTTSLTILAFTLVVALLVAMSAFVNGMYLLTTSSGRADNVVILSEGSTDEIMSNLGFSDIGDLENHPSAMVEGGLRLVSRENYMIVNQPLENAPPGRPSRRFLQLRGVDDPIVSGRVHGMELYPEGAWFSQAGVRDVVVAGKPNESMIEVVVGEGLAREMALDRGESSRSKPRLDVGDVFELNDRKWIISGVMRSAGLTFDSELWAKRSLVGPLFGRDSYTSLVVRTADPATAAALKDYYNNDFKKAAVAAQVETDYYSDLNETNKQFLFIIVLITVFTSVGGIFGVMNTMYAAVSQRIREIGVLRLLGFNRRQVLASFLLESIMIAILGGAVGCAVGSLVDGWTANSIVSRGPGGGKFVVLQLTVDADIIATGMVLSLAMGIVGGILPAVQAVRLKVLDTLR